MIFNADNIHKFFEPHIFERGVILQREHHVSKFSISEDHALIQAEVLGSQKTPYQIRIQTSIEKNKEFTYAQCSCPMAYQCKHIAAALITALEHIALANLPPLDQRITWLKEATQAAHHNHSQNAEHWLANVISAVGQPSTLPTPSGNTHALLYHLSLSPKAPQHLNLNLRVTRKVKKGGYGNVHKHFSANNNTHFQALLPIDHDILHKIEILNRMHDHRDSIELYQSEYNLTSTLDADPVLFEQILNTGRAYWCKNDTSLLLHTGPHKKAELQWSLQDSSEQQLTCLINGAPVQALPLLPLWYVHTLTGETGILELDGDLNFSKTLLFSPPLAPQVVSEISTLLNTRFKSHHIPAPHVFKTQKVDVIQPKPRLRLLGIARDYRYFPYNQSDDTGTNVLPIGRMSFIYENAEVLINGPEAIHSVNKKTNILTLSSRQFDLESAHINALLEHNVSILRKIYPAAFDPKLKTTDFLIGTLGVIATQEAFLQDKVPALKKLGWDILYEPSFPVEHIIDSDDWYTEFTEATEYNWFTMEMGVMVDNQKMQKQREKMQKVTSN